MESLKTLSAALLILLFGACKKEGLGGQASVTGSVQHHGRAIPNATVYIKYGVSELPGTDPAVYDNSKTATSGDAKFEFAELKKGDYFLYAIGYDSTCACVVEGGTGIKIKRKSEVIQTNLAVTEK